MNLVSEVGNFLPINSSVRRRTTDTVTVKLWRVAQVADTISALEGAGYRILLHGFMGQTKFIVQKVSA